MILPIEAKEALLSKSTKNNMDKVIAPFEPKTFNDSMEAELNLASLESVTSYSEEDITDDSILEVGSLLSKLNLKVSEEYLIKKYT